MTELKQRLVNFRVYLNFALLALWYDSTTFSLSMLAAHQNETDSIITGVIKNNKKYTIMPKDTK